MNNANKHLEKKLATQKGNLQKMKHLKFQESKKMIL